MRYMHYMHYMHYMRVKICPKQVERHLLQDKWPVTALKTRPRLPAANALCLRFVVPMFQWLRSLPNHCRYGCWKWLLWSLPWWLLRWVMKWLKWWLLYTSWSGLMSDLSQCLIGTFVVTFTLAVLFAMTW